MWPVFNHRRLPRQWLVAVAAAVFVIGFAGGESAADRVVLRNLKIYNNAKIASFDEDGVRLSGGVQIGWDDIESISVAADQQEKADRLLADLGDPLYRIRQRLKVGDYKELLSHAEAVYPRYADRSSATAYMVKQAFMWGLLAAGRREEAVAPYLGCYDYIRRTRGQGANLLGERRLVYDAKTGMSPELQPVWFDASTAKNVLPQVLKAAGAMQKPLPVAARIYFASLAAAAGDQAGADRVLNGIEADDAASKQLVALVRAQSEVLAGKPGPALSGLETSLESLQTENKPVALYWLATAKLANSADATKRAGVLQLLHIPALFGDKAPELAAAALYQAKNSLTESGDAKGAIAVRRELLEKYGHTYHAEKVKKDLTPGKDD